VRWAFGDDQAEVTCSSPAPRDNTSTVVHETRDPSTALWTTRRRRCFTSCRAWPCASTC